MRVLALASHKGGSGKTTLAAHLAVAASHAGAGPVVLVDLDAHGALADWWDAREVDDLAFADTHVARLATDLDRLRQCGFRLAIIDTPPANPMIVQAAVQHADLTVMPFRPSPLDLRAAGLTIGMPYLRWVSWQTPFHMRWQKALRRKSCVLPAPLQKTQGAPGRRLPGSGLPRR